MRKNAPRITQIRTADAHNQVVTVEGGKGTYRKKPCRKCPCYKAEIVDDKNRTASTRATLVLGEVQGRCELPAHVIAGAARLAAEFFTAQEEHEWSGDQVETYAEPLWFKRAGATWRPDVTHLGLTPTGEQSELVVTAGVDPHTDDVHGLVLLVVLHNDGLKFKQGKVSIAPAAGDWFIFDDRRNHSVSSAPGRAVFVGWAIPLTGKVG